MRFAMGGMAGLMERVVIGGKQVGKMCGISGGRWWWDVELPHILADSFRANKNGCRVSRHKDG